MGESAIILKYSTLLLITVQTSSMVLLLRYSRRQTADPKDAYINSTAVFLSEFAKLIICLVVIAWNGEVFVLLNLTAFAYLLSLQIPFPPFGAC